jgi:RimJ/RimL family protein N-acetyltransferase
MSNITLRKFKEKDFEKVKECLDKNIIPVVCVIAPDEYRADILLQDYMTRDENCEIALVITDSQTDKFLGAFDGILVDNTMLLTYYVLPIYQNKGICTMAMAKIFEYFKKNMPYVKKIRLTINNQNIASHKVAKKSGFAITHINEFAVNWEYKIS